MTTHIEQDAVDPLGGQVAVVTGAARGIGEAIALRLARMGAEVVLTARDSARLTQVRAAIEEQAGKAMVLPCDLTATIFSCLGYGPGSEFHDNLGRPQALSRGEVIQAAF